MDVKCSKIFFDEAKKMNCDAIMFKTGHSPIKEKMKELHSPLSGEMSGHVCYADDFYGYDDAMYVALRLLRILSSQNEKLSDLISQFPKRKPALVEHGHRERVPCQIGCFSKLFSPGINHFRIFVQISRKQTRLF